MDTPTNTGLIISGLSAILGGAIVESIRAWKRAKTKLTEAEVIIHIKEMELDAEEQNDLNRKLLKKEEEVTLWRNRFYYLSNFVYAFLISEGKATPSEAETDAIKNFLNRVLAEVKGTNGAHKNGS